MITRSLLNNATLEKTSHLQWRPCLLSIVISRTVSFLRKHFHEQLFFGGMESGGGGSNFKLWDRFFIACYHLIDSNKFVMRITLWWQQIDWLKCFMGFVTGTGKLHVSSQMFISIDHLKIRQNCYWNVNHSRTVHTVRYDRIDCPFGQLWENWRAYS